MLRSLHIRHFVLIDSLDIEFPEGLVIITGQTGAGKSIILGALSLVSGAKADAGMISEGADNCVVEAEFDTDASDAGIRALLDENEVEWDDGHLIVRRVVNASGRSRSFINDCPVQVQVLAELSSRLVDIHSQHQSLLLTDRNFQLSILDHFAGNAGSVAECRESWSRCQGLRKELEAAKARLSRLEAERGYNDAQYRELEAAALKDGELEDLEEEQKALANAEQIKECLTKAAGAFDPEEAGGAQSMASALKEASRQLSHAAKFIPSLEELCRRIDSARIEIEDISGEIEDINARTIVSDERLAIVDDRLSMLYSLLTKHGCRTVAELIEVRDRYSEALFDSDSLVENVSQLEGELKKASAAHTAICKSLSVSRSKAAPGFSKAILDSLRFLELDRSAFIVELEPCAEGPSGADAISFRFSASGSNPVDVAKCASGGEISRIMLSLKAMMAKFVGMPTLIFDEIDTGVSGSVADRMGSMICDMGKDMQVFSITHLPQVAAKGDAHYVVSKSYDESGRATSSIRQVDGEERIAEVARLLSGSTVTPEAIANAKALINGK